MNLENNKEEQFYPTPDEVIKKMLHPYYTENKWNELSLKITDKIILDPSAGKGNILDFITDDRNNGYTRIDRNDIFAIEINPDLMHILRDKGYNVISNNFLEYNDDIYFDLIVMNPPFNSGVKHILKAWEILKDGDIVCLLNSETINNPYSKERQLLQNIIKDNNGVIEELGPVFKDSERLTNVNVSIVRLSKKSNDFKFDFEFEEKEDVPEFDKEMVENNDIALNDVVGNFIRQYELSKKAFVEYMKARQKIDFYTNDLFSEYSSVQDIIESIGYTDKSSYTQFANRLRAQAWNKIINKLDLHKLFTSSVYKSMKEMQFQQGKMELTKKNIFELFDMLILNRTTFLKQAIQDVFDYFTKYYKENRCHIEGWKTNEAWKVNKKVILPYAIEFSDIMHDFRLSYSNTSPFSDIDKVMCFLTGKSHDHINSIAGTLENHFRLIGTIEKGDKFTNVVYSSFFKIRFFKKGTVHLEFRDEDLWEKFNHEACKERNWLPKSTERTAYKKTTDVKAQQTLF